MNPHLSTTGEFYIVGDGGHARECRFYLAAAQRKKFAGFANLSGENGCVRQGDLPIGTEALLALGLPNMRKGAYQQLATQGVKFLSLVASEYALLDSIPEGYIAAPGAIVTCDVSIGAHVHLNVGATVSHDCVIGDFSTLSPNSSLCGAVTLGSNVFVGAGAVVLPGVTIGDHAVIGAGAVVTKDVLAGSTVAGSPAKPLVKKK